jgi:iron complex transport system substrate-binding protein
VTRLRLTLLLIIASATSLVACERHSEIAAAVEANTAPPQRIVSLAPHLTELIFALGAQDRLVGVSEFSNFPPEAVDLPRIGDAFRVDQERLAQAHPDLILAWASGTPKHVVNELREQGYRVETIHSKGLSGVSAAIKRLGELTGTPSEAAAIAAEFESGLQKLAERYARRSSIRVFYQISLRPLYTVNKDHAISELIELCGGKNVFDDLGELAPLIGVEAVLDRDTEIILAATDATSPFTEWARWKQLSANRYANEFQIPADLIARDTPRLLLAGAAVCEALQQGRDNRTAFSK